MSPATGEVRQLAALHGLTATLCTDGLCDVFDACQMEDSPGYDVAIAKLRSALRQKHADTADGHGQ